MYNDICLFKEIEGIILFNNRNHKISDSVGLRDNKMHGVNVFFDTRAGPNLIGEDFHKTEWLEAIQPINRSAPKYATDKKVSVVGKISLHVIMGDSTVRAFFSVVRSLVVPIL